MWEILDSSALTDTPSDQRRYPRTQVSFDIDVWVTDAGRETRTSGRLVVLSAGGAFLELDDGYPVGGRLRLRFELADLGRIGCRAIVRCHLEDRGVGVEFLHIDLADRTRIMAFVQKHQARLRQSTARSSTGG